LTTKSLSNNTTLFRHTLVNIAYVILFQRNIVNNANYESFIGTCRDAASVFRIVADSTPEVVYLVKGYDAEASQRGLNLSQRSWY
jgi:hypothetical protein